MSIWFPTELFTDIQNTPSPHTVGGTQLAVLGERQAQHPVSLAYLHEGYVVELPRLEATPWFCGLGNGSCVHRAPSPVS